MMSLIEMKQAEIKAKSAILEITAEYDMSDKEVECFYHKLILSLAEPCAYCADERWAEEKCAYQKNRI